MNPFLHTHHGHQVHFLNPKVSEIDIRDIAHVLSRIPRFNGHTTKPYYVAQHICICCDNVSDDIKLEALAHDFSESFACDIPSPLKSLLPQYKEIERRLEKVIARKFSLKFPFPAGVKDIDMRVLVTEMRDLTTFQGWTQIPFVPLNKKIVPWSIERSRKELLNRFEKLKRN